MYLGKTNNNDLLDFVGIGVGPSNLSLAALLNPIELQCLFIEKKIKFQWHEDVLLDESSIQVHYLKDCVTLVDPTNPFSFLQFLLSKNRIYHFLNKKTPYTSRKEYAEYYQWVSEKISYLRFGEEILDINYDAINKIFLVRTSKQSLMSRSLVLGTGQTPYIPPAFLPFLSEKVFHTSSYLKYYKKIKHKSVRSVAIIGGGQSGAEIIQDLLSSQHLPEKIFWISKKLNFHPLEDSCFSNEFYTPSYVNYFYSLDQNKKDSLLQEQVLTSDGISENLINDIYRRIYEIKFVLKKDICIFAIGKHELIKVSENFRDYTLTFRDMISEEVGSCCADVLIFATGYKSTLPACLKPIIKNIPLDVYGRPFVNENYSIKWEHEKSNKIYIQNGARHSHGIADSNLSLISWRSAIIINNLINYPFYKFDYTQSILKQGSAFENTIKEFSHAM